MRDLDELLRCTSKNPPTFHPAHERSESAWFPGNEAASLLLQCRYIWDDIESLAEIRGNIKDAHTRKLLVKYLIIEIRSLIEVLDRLQAHVMKADVFNPETESAYRGLTYAEHAKAKELFKAYSRAKQETERLIIEVRDNIGAHRGNINWQQVMKFWDQVSIETVSPVLKVVPDVFETIKEFNIYEWNRYLPDGAIEFVGSRIYSESMRTDA
jgi:hypothetical protein